MTVKTMRALTVEPRRAGSARLEVQVPPPSGGADVVVRTIAVGVCGTDREILAGHYGAAPKGQQRLILGHESVGRVESAPPGSGFASGDLVVGIVRHPDPVPCSSCAVGEWDMCRNGLYTEHGIKERNGFCAERFSIEPGFLVSVPSALEQLAVLVEPASVMAKAWEQIERIGQRTHWRPRRVLITGAGPIGLLGALIGRERGFEIHVYDRVEAGLKPALTRALGAHYHSGSLEQVLADAPPDIVIECTGASHVVLDTINGSGRGAIVCLIGVSEAGRQIPVDVGRLNRSMVLENDVVFGSVNANRRHYEAAARTLASASPAWLSSLITRRVPLGNWEEALQKRPDDIKVVLDLT